MSQKKARRNRAHDLSRDLYTTVMSGDGWKTILAHLLWSLPPDELKARLAGTGPSLTITIADAHDAGRRPSLVLGVATEDAIKLVSDDVDADMIQAVTDDYFELLDPFFPEDFVVTLSATRLDGSDVLDLAVIRPEDYKEAQSEPPETNWVSDPK